MKFFDTFTILSIFLLFAGTLSAQDCPDFTQNNLSRITENCQSGVVECLAIDYEFSGDYEYTLNGSPYNGDLTPCGVGNIAAYDVLGIANYPINIDSWEVDGLVFSNFIVGSPGALADSMSVLSGVTWTFDVMDFKIQTTDVPDSLSWLAWTEINTGLTAATTPEYSSAGSNTAFEFPIGNNVLIAYNFIQDCADTLLIDVVCEQITDTITFNIYTADSDSVFINPSNLGPINSFANECSNQSGVSVDFAVNTSNYIVSFDGVEAGTEQACIVLCDVNGVCDTTYIFVTVTDVVTCTDPVVDLVNVVDMNCDEPGSIQLFMQDQNQEYQFNWDNNLPNTDYVFDLSAGTYNVTITSGDSTQQLCTTTASYTVAFLDSLAQYNYTINPSCDNNGEVFFTNPGLTYTWEDGFVGQSRFDLWPGDYSVTVSSNNCEEVTIITMVGSFMDIFGSVNNVCDSLGAIFLDVSGGFQPYSYFWSDGFSNSNRFDMDVGTYTVTVTDAQGCTAESSFEIVDDCPGEDCVDPIITNVITVNPSCVDSGSIVIELSDTTLDYVFDWSHNGPNSATQTGLWPGDFEVIVSNISTTGEVCSDSMGITLFLTDSLNFFLVVSGSATCAGPGFAEYSNSNLIYNWSDGGTGYIRNDLVAGNYSIIVSHPDGNCETVDVLTIQQGSEITLTGSAHNVCDSLGSIYLSVSGGVWPYTYQWTNGVTTLSQPELNVGTYTLTVTDDQGCTLVQTYEIVDDCPAGCVVPVIVDVSIVNPNCMEDGLIDFGIETPSPNLTYEWSNGSTMPHMQIDIPAGSYSVTVTETDPATGVSCSTTETFVLVTEDSLGFSLINITPASCGTLGGAEYSDPSLLYNWSDGGFGHMRNDLTPGDYTVTVTNSPQTCIDLSFITILEINNIDISANVANVCDTLGSIYMNVDGGVWPYTYEWSNGTFTQSQPELNIGIYTVTVTDTDGCTNTETYEIIDDCSTSGCVEPIIVASDTQDPDCNNLGRILLEVGNFNSNMSYIWSHNGPNSNIQTGLEAGNYGVTISNIDPMTGDSCFTTAFFSLVASDSLDFFLVNKTPAGCDSLGSAEYSNFDLLYNWSDGGSGHFRGGLAVGEYTITVTNAQGNCAEVTSLTIDDGSDSIDAVTLVSNVCDTLGSIYLNVDGGVWPYTYNWADLSGSSNPSFRENIDVGNYMLTITDDVGCELTLNFDIVDDCPTTGDLIFTFVPSDLNIECGDTAPIESPIAESDCPGDITYDFSETQSPNCGNTNILTRIWVATDDCGNTASAQQTIFEQDLEAPEIITVGNILVDLLNGDSLPNPFDLAFAEDDCGIVGDLSFTKEESITTDGYQVAYNWTAIDECGNLSTELHTVDVTGGMIWPGDTDSNKVVNNFDVFNIGFAYGTTGPTRMSPTLDFLPQYAAPWSENGLDAVNFRHADTDGNGIVDEQDILAVNLNYDLVHNLQEAGDTRETFEIDFVYETVTADNWVHVAILLGNNSEPIDDFYGAGFIIEYDQTMVVPNTAHVDFSESWTGTFFGDFIALQKDFHDEGRLDVGLVRTNQQGIDGSGKIGSFRFQLPEGVEFTPFTLTAREGDGVRADKSPYELQTTEVIVTDVKEFLPLSAIQAYPNPVKTELFLTIPTEFEVTNIQLFGTNGQMVKEYTDTNTRTLEVSTLPAGLYYLRVLTNEGTWTDKVSIMK